MTRRHRNVLLITADQWRGDCLSAVGHPVVRSPNLDALAGEGVLFEQHYANAVPCGPSRACLHTGMYLHNHRSGTNGTPLDRRFTNWALEARRAGYDPALFGYTHTAPDPRYLTADDPRLNTDEGILPGIKPVVDMATHCGPWRDWLKQFGYALPEDHGTTYGLRAADHADPAVPRPSVFAPNHTDTWFLVQSAMDYIGAHARTEPGWAVHLSVRAPHPPCVASDPYHARYPLGALPPPKRRDDVDTEGALHPWLAAHLGADRNAAHPDPVRHRMLQASYYGLMAEVDDNMGRLFAHLKALGEWDDTLVVFTSDHGEQMGDHWLYGKAGFFDQSYHIPLIVRLPDGIPQGRVGAFTEHVDIMPTLLQWIGVDSPRQCDGRALQPFLDGTGAPRDWRTEAHWEYDFRDSPFIGELKLTLETSGLNVVRSRDAKYVHFADLPPLLFDLKSDPGEFVDLAQDERRQNQIADYSRRLLSWRMRHTDKTLSHMRVTPATGLIDLAMTGGGA
jgi:arylsulfatase A-like enzyme